MSSSTLPPSQPLPLRHLLETYTTSHPLRTPSPLPPSSRVDPKLRQRLPPPTSASPLLWTLPTWWLFIRFVFTKGIHIALALISHFLFGPKRPSWGYRMTFITSFMRNIADHSSLADIVLIRRFISLHFLVPLPGDAVVTPITFTVPRRKAEQVARGFLRDLDVAETGSRQLSGEWVVGTEVWKRLRAEKRARQKKQRASPRHNLSPSGRSLKQTKVEIEPEALKEKGKANERVIYYVHGGAYYVGNAATHRLITIGVSKSCNARVFGTSLVYAHNLSLTSGYSNNIPACTRTCLSPPSSRRSLRLFTTLVSPSFHTSGEYHHRRRLCRWRPQFGAVHVPP